MYLADVVIATSHALEIFPVMMSSATIVSCCLVLGNIPATKHLTIIWFCDCGCRSEILLQTIGHFGMSVAAGQGVKEAIKFTVKQ